MADSFVSRFGCYTIIRDTTEARHPAVPHYRATNRKEVRIRG